MSTQTVYESDARILSLFENASETPTPTPNVKAWLVSEFPTETRVPERSLGDTGDSPWDSPGGTVPVSVEATSRLMLLKRLTNGAESGGWKRAKATEALTLIHPGIVRTRRWLTDSGHLYVVRDVVRGKNLRQALTTATGERPSLDLLRMILLPLFEALSHAHRQGIVHGGISAENILVAEEGRILISDFATADPNAPRHQPNYAGKATMGGDIRALGNVMAAYIPNTGAFQSPVVRGRIESLIRKCDTLDDLKEVLNSLERLVSPPMSRPKDGVPERGPVVGSSEEVRHLAGDGRPISYTPVSGMPLLEFPPSPVPSPFAMEQPEERENIPAQSSNRTATGQDTQTRTAEEEGAETPVPMSVTVQEMGRRVPQGGGSVVTATVRNEGPTPLVLRMVATQYPWLNVRPVKLPLRIPSLASETVEFSVSAARLTPGEYRSEVYLSVHTPGDLLRNSPTGVSTEASPAEATSSANSTGENLIKFTAEVRVTVEAPALPVDSKANPPAYPANAPKLPGCAALLFVGSLGLGCWAVKLWAS